MPYSNGSWWRRGRRRGLAALSLSALAWAGCTDFDAPPPADRDLPDELVADPSFTEHIQPIFTARCATAGCHTGTSHQGGLVLSEEQAYDQLVGVPSRYSPGVLRVEQFNAAGSFLVATISETGDRAGLPRMPLGRQPLTDNQIGTIVNWIENGAERN